MAEGGIIVVMLALSITLGVGLVLTWIDYIFGNNDKEEDDD